MWRCRIIVKNEKMILHKRQQSNIFIRWVIKGGSLNMLNEKGHFELQPIKRGDIALFDQFLDELTLEELTEPKHIDLPDCDKPDMDISGR